MSDVKELFDMVTKQTEPDLDSWKEQEDRQRKKARQRRFGAFIVAAGIVAVGAIAFATLGGNPDTDGAVGGPTPPDDGVVNVVTHWYLDLATGEQTPVTPNLGAASISEVSPDGERIAYSTCCNDDAIFVAALDGSGAEIVTPEELDGYDPSWIDDDTILFQGRPEGTFKLGDLYTVAVSSGAVRKIVDLPDEKNTSWIIRSDISPDGTTVLYHLPRGKGRDAEYDLWTVPITGGEPTLVREDAGYASYSSDGSIVFLDHPYPFEGDSIWIMDGDGGNARELAAGDGPYGWPVPSPDGTKILTVIENDTPEVIDTRTGETTTYEDLYSEDPAWFGNGHLIG